MARETFPNNSFTDVVLHYDSELKKQLYEYLLHIQRADFLSNFAKLFVKIPLEFIVFRADFYWNFTKFCRINKNYQTFGT